MAAKDRPLGAAEGDGEESGEGAEEGLAAEGDGGDRAGPLEADADGAHGQPLSDGVSEGRSGFAQGGDVDRDGADLPHPALEGAGVDGSATRLGIGGEVDAAGVQGPEGGTAAR